MERRRATVAVIGAGDFIGGAIARKFAAEGFTVFAGRRNGEKLVPLVQAIEAAGGRAFARSLDARQEDDIAALLREPEAEAPLEVCIFTIGANVHFSLVDTTERVFRKVWEMACYGGFLAGRDAARLMLPRGHGAIFFPGASARLCAGARPPESARRPHDHRCRSGYGVGARADQRARGRCRVEQSRFRPSDEAR